MLTFYANNKAVSLQREIFKQTKVQNHKVVNSKLRIGIIIAIIVIAFMLFAIIWKSMQIEQFSELLTEHWQYLLKSWVMVSFISRYTLKLKLSCDHMFITHEPQTTLLTYMSYTGGLWRVLEYYPLILVTIDFTLR